MLPPGAGEPFLRAIYANPADDAPRLVYADWLEENGDSDRADFIRWQIALYRAKEAGDDVTELEERLRPLRLVAETIWRPQLPALRGVSWHRYWRGFVSGADFHSARWFFQRSAAAFASVPLQFMRIHGLRPDHAKQFAACELLQRLERLTLLDRPNLLFDKGWKALIQSPHFRNLKSLHLRGQFLSSFRPRQPEHVFLLSDKAVAWLADSPTFEQLEELVIIGALSEKAQQMLRDRFGSGFTLNTTK